MKARVFISRDSGALCVGADDVARALFKAAETARARRRDRPQRLARHVLAGAAGRGRDGRRAASATGRSSPPMSTACSMPACSKAASIRSVLGLVEDIPFLQEADPADLRPLRHHRSAVARGLRGAWRLQGAGEGPRGRARGHRRGGGQFRPARPRRRGLSDRDQVGTVAQTPPQQKYIVCNADEGDSGTFADRMMMEGDPFVLIEGMAIAGIAVGATKGYVYIRSEYPACRRGDGDRHPARARRRHAGRECRRARAMPSTWRCASAPGPMSAARRPRC